jgi:hypothetical protein
MIMNEPSPINDILPLLSPLLPGSFLSFHRRALRLVLKALWEVRVVKAEEIMKRERKIKPQRSSPETERERLGVNPPGEKSIHIRQVDPRIGLGI